MKPRVFLVTSALYFVEWFLIDQIRAAAEQFEISVLVKTQDVDFLSRRNIDARVIPTDIEREIRPFADLRALFQLYRSMKKERPVLVHSTGPKGGLLGMAAARAAGVPVRIHTFTGQVWTNSTGLRRLMLKMADCCTGWLATDVLVDSQSQKHFIVDEHVVPARKATVLGQGSISGVNVERFVPDSVARAKVRDEYGISEDAFLILYMARLTRDKGALVMAEGFACLARDYPGEVYLLVVGPDEEELTPRLKQICHECLTRVHFVGYTNQPESFMAAADVLCLPSYREGFGTVLINAASVGIPTIASRIYGSEDAVIDGETGLLIAPGNSTELAGKLGWLLQDPALRARLGSKGRERVCRDFAENVVTAAVIDFYDSKLEQLS